jgi:hypothetical protein
VGRARAKCCFRKANRDLFATTPGAPETGVQMAVPMSPAAPISIRFLFLCMYVIENKWQVAEPVMETPGENVTMATDCSDFREKPKILGITSSYR